MEPREVKIHNWKMLGLLLLVVALSSVLEKATGLSAALPFFRGVTSAILVGIGASFKFRTVARHRGLVWVDGDPQFDPDVFRYAVFRYEEARKARFTSKRGLLKAFRRIAPYNTCPWAVMIQAAVNDRAHLLRDRQPRRAGPRPTSRRGSMGLWKIVLRKDNVVFLDSWYQISTFITNCEPTSKNWDSACLLSHAWASFVYIAYYGNRTDAEVRSALIGLEAVVDQAYRDIDVPSKPTFSAISRTEVLLMAAICTIVVAGTIIIYGFGYDVTPATGVAAVGVLIAIAAACWQVHASRAATLSHQPPSGEETRPPANAISNSSSATSGGEEPTT